MTTTILIVDQHRMFREGLRCILETRHDFEVVAEGSTGRDAIRLATEARPDIVLIEAHLPKLSGLDAVRRIHNEYPRMRSIIITGSEGSHQVREALVAGASAFVPKTCDSEVLFQAIEAARIGRSYVAPEVAQQVVSAIASGHEGAGSLEDLTSRQREVLQLIAEGLSTKEIAAELGISIKTAQTHRTRLMSRTGVHKASSLVRFAIREGLVLL